MLDSKQLETMKCYELIEEGKKTQVAVWADVMNWCDENHIYDYNKWSDSLKDENRKWKSPAHSFRLKVMNELEDTSIFRNDVKYLDICNDIDKMYASVKDLKDKLNSMTEMYHIKMAIGSRGYHIYKFRNPSKWMEEANKDNDSYKRMVQHFMSLATGIYRDYINCSTVQAYIDGKITLDIVKMLCDPSCKR